VAAAPCPRLPIGGSHLFSTEQRANRFSLCRLLLQTRFVPAQEPLQGRHSS